MNKLLLKTKDFIFAQQTSILSSTLILSGMIFLSRIAGFARHRILLGNFTKEELDIFLASFRIPDLVFEVLINGALSTTFIPFFIAYQKSSKEQSRIISSIINVVFLTVVLFIIVLAIILPYIIPLITPGFISNPEKIRQIVYYSRILLLGQLPFLVLGNFLTGISQAKKSFFLPAIAPLFYNLAIIIFTVLFARDAHLAAPVIGVVFGSVLFFLVQLPILSVVDFQFKLVLSHVNESYKFFRTAIPRILTIIVAQIDATVDLTLASLLGSGSYTIFYLSQTLQLLPVSIIGISMGQASLPYLTDIYQDKKINEFKKIIIDSLLNILFFTIPAAGFFIITRTPIVRVFYGGAKFDWDGTVLTAYTLSYFAFSIPFHSIYYFLTRCFYAIFDTRTPFYVGFGSILLNASLSIIFTLVLGLPVWSLGISFSISMSLQVLVLIFLLNSKLKGLEIWRLFVESLKILIAAVNSSVLTYFLIRLLDGLILDTSRTLNVVVLLAIAFVFFTSLHLTLCWLFGTTELYILTKMITKVREYQQKLVEIYKGVE